MNNFSPKTVRMASKMLRTSTSQESEFANTVILAQQDRKAKRQEKIRLLKNEFGVQEELASRDSDANHNFIDLINRMKRDNHQKSQTLQRVTQKRGGIDLSFSLSASTCKNWHSESSKEVYTGLSQSYYRNPRHDFQSTAGGQQEEELGKKVVQLQMDIGVSQENQKNELVRQQQVKHSLDELQQEVYRAQEKNRALQGYSKMHGAHHSSLRLLGQKATREENHSQMNLATVKRQVQEVGRVERQYLQDTQEKQEHRHRNLQEMETYFSDLLLLQDDRRADLRQQNKDLLLLEHEKNALHSRNPLCNLSRQLGSLQLLREFLTGDSLSLAKLVPVYSQLPTLATACESEQGQSVLQEVTVFLMENPLPEMVGALVQKYKEYQGREMTLKRDYLQLVKEKKGRGEESERLGEECEEFRKKGGEGPEHSLMAMHFERREQGTQIAGDQTQQQTEFMFFLVVSLVNQLLRLAYILQKVLKDSQEEKRDLLLLAKSVVREYSRIVDEETLCLKRQGSSQMQKKAHMSQVHRSITHTLTHSISLPFLLDSLDHLGLQVSPPTTHQFLSLLQHDSILSTGATQDLVVDYLKTQSTAISQDPQNILEHVDQMRLQCVEGVAEKLDKVLAQYRQVLLSLQGSGQVQSRGISWEGLGEKNASIKAEQERAVDKLQKGREEEEIVLEEDCYQLEEMKQEIHDRMQYRRQALAEEARIKEEGGSGKSIISGKQERVNTLGEIRDTALHHEQKVRAQNNRNLRHLEVAMQRPSQTPSHLQSLRQDMSRYKNSLQRSLRQEVLSPLHLSSRREASQHPSISARCQTSQASYRPAISTRSQKEGLHSVYGQGLVSLKKQYLKAKHPTNQSIGRRIKTRE